MANSQKVRDEVFAKYNGRCAYCGNPLQKGWHVDEILPVIRYNKYVEDAQGKRIWDDVHNKYKTIQIITYPERFNVANQIPACASCNINKHQGSIEDFRKAITGFMKHLNEVSVQYKFAKRYGLVTETGNKVKFYFEQFENQPTNEKVDMAINDELD